MKPNIVFILTDDQGAWALGRETPEIITPNLDRMADEGVYFRNFFCASPVCSPARCSLVTGRLPSAHGVHDWLRGGNWTKSDLPEPMRSNVGDDTAIDYLEGMPTVYDSLRLAGYHMGFVGKWHMGDSLRKREGFDEWTVLLGGGCAYRHPDVCVDGVPQFLDEYVTDFFTDRAVDFINRHPKEPFSLHVHYTAPHTPWGHEQHREDILHMYDDCPFDCHPFRPLHPDQVATCEVGDTDERRRYLQKGYYSAITAVDEGVGRIMEALKENGVADNTVVIFSGDNGMNLGQHGVWGKGNGTYPQNMYDSSVKVPFIVWGPRFVRSGAVVDNLISHCDVLPTLREYLGQEQDASLPGESFLSELTVGRGDTDRKICILDEYGPVRMIRSRRWKLVMENIRGNHQLYDLENDPGEETNLYGDPSLSDIVKKLKEELYESFTRFTVPPYDGMKTRPSGSGQMGKITYEGEDVWQPDVRYFSER